VSEVPEIPQNFSVTLLKRKKPSTLNSEGIYGVSLSVVFSFWHRIFSKKINFEKIPPIVTADGHFAAEKCPTGNSDGANPPPVCVIGGVFSIGKKAQQQWRGVTGVAPVGVSRKVLR